MHVWMDDKELVVGVVVVLQLRIHRPYTRIGDARTTTRLPSSPILISITIKYNYLFEI